MKVTAEMKIKEVLEISEHMISAFCWLAPEFERLNNPVLRKAMSGRVTVSQAARIARIPVSEALYVLNLSAGEDSEVLEEELRLSRQEDFEYHETNPPLKPEEILGLKDSSRRITFVDVMEEAEKCVDPLPRITKGFESLKNKEDVLLIHHPFDPIPLRDLFAKRGFASWAEERKPGNWFIYFFRPQVSAKAIAHPQVNNRVFKKAAGASWV